MSLHEHVPHPQVGVRRAQGPIKVAAQHPQSSAASRFNTRLAIRITKVVGSMWCAYAFAAFDLISLPTAIRGGAATVVSWIAQTFLQLVLLSIIMVGQDVQAKAADRRAQQTFDDAEAILHGLEQHAAHLAAQDLVLTSIQGRLEQQEWPAVEHQPHQAHAADTSMQPQDGAPKP